MKAEFINPFLNAAKNVLETMAQTQVTPQKPRLKDGTTSYGEVTGIIGMTSAEITGSMIVSFTEKCILKIVGKCSFSLLSPLTASSPEELKPSVQVPIFIVITTG